MAAVAEQLEVVEVVAAAVAERDTMMHLEAMVGATADAGSITLADTVADLAPRPAIADLASRLPLVVAPRAGGAA